MKLIIETSNAKIYLTPKGTILKTFKDKSQDINQEAKITELAGKLLVGAELLRVGKNSLEIEYLIDFKPLKHNYSHSHSLVLDAFRNQISGSSFLECLNTLHSNWIGHGDIHQGNVLIDSDDNVAIIDYGAALSGENQDTARNILDDLYCILGLKDIFQTDTTGSKLLELMRKTIESYCNLVSSNDSFELCQYYVKKLREII